MTTSYKFVYYIQLLTLISFILAAFTLILIWKFIVNDWPFVKYDIRRQYFVNINYIHFFLHLSVNLIIFGFHMYYFRLQKRVSQYQN